MPRRITYTDVDRIILQANLQALRNITGNTAEEFGEKIGVTKQTISKLENSDGQTNLINKTQFIAILAVLENEIEEQKNTVLEAAMKYLFDEDKKSDTSIRLIKNDNSIETAVDDKISQIGATAKGMNTVNAAKAANPEKAMKMTIHALAPIAGALLGVGIATAIDPQNTFNLLKKILKK